MTLAPHEDAYGQLLLAALEGREADEIMERDDGLIYRGDPRDYFHPYRRWPATERRAMRFVRGRVLDVGCGAGRVSLHLQERGHAVVAIDESPLAVEVARRRGVGDARALGLADVDDSLDRFDTVLLVRNNFGLLGSERASARFGRLLARVLAPGGRVITDSVDPERVDDPAFREYRRRGSTERPAAQRVRVRYRQFATPWFSYVMVAPDELAGLVGRAGFEVVETIDDGSPRYSVVLARPPARVSASSASRGNAASRRAASAATSASRSSPQGRVSRRHSSR